MESSQSSVSATRGSTTTLPCHFHYEPEIVAPRRTRVKWSLLPANTPADASTEMEVMVAIGNRHRSYGSFRGRVRLRRSVPGDLSLVIDRLQVNDAGRYRCEVIDGLEDQSVTVELRLRGVCVWAWRGVSLLRPVQRCCFLPRRGLPLPLQERTLPSELLRSQTGLSGPGRQPGHARAAPHSLGGRLGLVQRRLVGRWKRALPSHRTA